MAGDRRSLRPIQGADHPRRRRLNIRGEFLLALLPTAVVLTVLALLEVFSHQRLLFASLASSAFLIYLDPEHGTNTTRCLVLSHLVASISGMLIYLALDADYVSGGVSMLSFAFRDESVQTLAFFIMALGLVAVLVVLQRSALWLVSRLRETTT